MCVCNKVIVNLYFIEDKDSNNNINYHNNNNRTHVPNTNPLLLLSTP